MKPSLKNENSPNPISMPTSKLFRAERKSLTLVF